MHPFERSGFAALSDLKTKEWKEIYEILEKDQAEFLKYEKEFRSPEYKWPSDSLHTWSRVWEYPYVYYHLKKFRESWKESRLPKVIDFGSGVTFFPFSVAKLGYDVICIDNDPISINDLNKAIKLFKSKNISSYLSKNNKIYNINHKFDIIYSISVIEHIHNYKIALENLKKLLFDRGLLILTIDVDLRDEGELSTKEFPLFNSYISDHFNYIYSCQSVHPIDLLTSYNNIFRLRKVNFINYMYLLTKKILYALLYKQKIFIPPKYLTILALFLINKND